ncbi:hypothetical protein H632_c1567p0 [Helicosporidium sp. ATCC 50920]|nr:hypothetical protein H632_c1567p0 [Helicosporidium sp. ATCC 50920]|eukprot:KDD74104.1 hypothetical protein H632_c1567p0 [Helicosporidium sp. ATCC 50920]
MLHMAPIMYLAARGRRLSFKSVRRKPGKREPSDAEMRARIRAILQGADFNQISAKSVRVALEEAFKCSLAHRRALIRDEIASCMEQKEAASTQVEQVEKPPSKKPKAVKLVALSPALAAFMGQEYMSRGEVTKKLWEYIKAEKLQDEKDKRRILIDEKLGTIFPGKSINMFRIATLLTKHCHNVDDLVDRR